MNKLQPSLRATLAVGFGLLLAGHAMAQAAKPCDDSPARYKNLEAQAVKKMDPYYPNDPGFHVTGKVIVWIEVDSRGKVISAKALCGHPMLMAWSVGAARHWKFHPRKVNGRPRKNTGVITFVFPSGGRSSGSKAANRTNPPTTATNKGASLDLGTLLRFRSLEISWNQPYA